MNSRSSDVTAEPRCGRQAMALVTELLQRHNVDLANVVELPESYKCARDGTGMGRGEGPSEPIH